MYMLLAAGLGTNVFSLFPGFLCGALQSMDAIHSQLGLRTQTHAL